ncbi:helix-turn-helix domain-containing protein, partial [Anaerostipes caccae]|uniref:helix-turn-helix domain-containing protein n=1 Tax=Anaerostipes caccae TaxID=105841 RepID=UPI00210EB20B
DLSDLLGISRSHVTRGLSQLREQEIILTRRKQIEIRDLPALTEYCSLETL